MLEYLREKPAVANKGQEGGHGREVDVNTMIFGVPDEMKNVVLKPKVHSECWAAVLTCRGSGACLTASRRDVVSRLY